jgi:glycine cleavage system H lipoate-binding protein
MTPSNKHFKVVPSDELCIWMAAGLLSYQLCDRQFECDSCPLDHALRVRMRQHSTKREEGLGKPAYGALEEPLREDFRYSRNHCWAKQLGANLLKVGIEPGMSAALLTPKTIVFLSRGQSLVRRQACLWIVLEGGTLPLDSPIEGLVRDTNPLLAGEPHLLHFQPFDDGWLYEIEADSAAVEAANFMDWEQASSKYASDKNAFIASLQTSQRKNNPSVGVTLADGGQRLQNTADILGPSRYFDIVRKAFN